MNSYNKRDKDNFNKKLRIAAGIVRAIAHPLRLRILAFIDLHGEINVNRIYNSLKLEQSITSQHLRILRLGGIVSTSSDGENIYYFINYSLVANTVKAINRFLDET